MYKRLRAVKCYNYNTWKLFVGGCIYSLDYTIGVIRVLVFPICWDDDSIRKHQHTDYTHKTVQTVYAATKQTNFHVLKLLRFYTLYFMVQHRSREHFNVLNLLSCNFNNSVTSAKHKVKTP